MFECVYCGAIINHADVCWNCGRMIDGEAYELEAEIREENDLDEWLDDEDE